MCVWQQYIMREAVDSPLAEEHSMHKAGQTAEPAGEEGRQQGAGQGKGQRMSHHATNQLGLLLLILSATRPAD